jgi:hypothetical protein
MKIIVFWIIFGAVASPLFAQVTPQTLKPFKSLCIDEKSTGYNWNNSRWDVATFNLSKYTLEKVDYDKGMLSEKVIDRPLSCGRPTATNIDNEKDIVLACYAVNRFGRPTYNAVHAANCLESFKGGVIQSIYCSGVGSFRPNGLFIKLPTPTALDVSDSIYKDSMVVSVGTCGVL